MTIELLILVIVVLGLTLYAVWGGADFGAGVWEFNTALRAGEKERALLYQAIGPVWEANHVWLIFIIVAMFSAFPPAFAVICQTLWLPLLLALAGIVFRGAGYVFHAYTAGAGRARTVWSAVFALASTATPFFLGAAMGAVASGSLQVAAPTDHPGQALLGWISPLAIFNGFFTVGMCAYVSAVYLVREAHVRQDEDLIRLWRRRALTTGIAVGGLAMAGLVLVIVDAPDLWQGFERRGWPFIFGSAAAGFISLAALFRRWYNAAVIGASGAVAAVVWGWAIAQYPLLVPPETTIAAAKAPDAVLLALAWSMAGGSLLVAPALAYLFYLFKSRSRASHVRSPGGGPPSPMADDG